MSDITEEEWQKMSPEERSDHQVKNCIFCKIIKGEIPSKKFYEDSNFVGILDINPGSKGHVLVLPKKHVQIMPQLGTELNGELGIVSKKISSKVKKAIGVSATSVFVANGAVAGQNAPHFMMHIIPRRNSDNVKLNPNLSEMNISLINASRKKIIQHLGLPDLASKPLKTGERTPHDIRIKGEIEDETDMDYLEEQENPKRITDKTDKKPDKDLLDKISDMFD
jgi:histidine triad (HIT) family protein